jgi:hypothetical protein
VIVRPASSNSALRVSDWAARFREQQIHNTVRVRHNLQPAMSQQV